MKEKFVDANGSIWGVHTRETCDGSYCAIHNPSDHPLNNAPIALRGNDPFSLKPYGFAERICTHGVGHSDPDSVNFYDSIGQYGTGVHGCDGCCRLVS